MSCLDCRLTFDLSEERGNVLVVEGQRSAKQRVEDDPARPDVHLGAGIQLSGDHLATFLRLQSVAGLK